MLIIKRQYLQKVSIKIRGNNHKHSKYYTQTEKVTKWYLFYIPIYTSRMILETNF